MELLLTTYRYSSRLLNHENNYLVTVFLTAILGLLIIWVLQCCESTQPFVPHKRNKLEQRPLDLDACRAKWKANQSTTSPTEASYLVIGAGFLGSRLIEALLLRGESNVTVFDFDDRVKWASDARVRFVHGDIRNAAHVHDACRGIQTVFLTAASIRFMDDWAFQWKRSYDVNVIGTQNVIDACVANGVDHLIQTSTMMVNVPKTLMEDHSHHLLTNPLALELTEDMPYVTRENSTSHYATTKAMAEKLVRDANGRNDGRLRTLCLRPTGIFGARDQINMEIMMRQNAYVFLGLDFMLDFLYVDNAVHAHLLGETALRRRRGGAEVDGDVDVDVDVGGEAMYITNEEPMRNNHFRRMVVHYAKIRYVLHGPPRLFYLLAHGFQICRLILRHKMPSLGDLEFLTPCAWKLMNLDIQVKPTKIQTLLGYHPIFSVEEGIQLAAREYQHGQTIFSVS